MSSLLFCTTVLVFFLAICFLQTYHNYPNLLIFSTQMFHIDPFPSSPSPTWLTFNSTNEPMNQIQIEQMNWNEWPKKKEIQSKRKKKLCQLSTMFARHIKWMWNVNNVKKQCSLSLNTLLSNFHTSSNHKMYYYVVHNKHNRKIVQIINRQSNNKRWKNILKP